MSLVAPDCHCNRSPGYPYYGYVNNEKLVAVKKLDERAIMPTRNNPTDAGLDLYALENTKIDGLADYSQEFVVECEYIYETFDDDNEALQKINDIEDYKPTKVRTGISIEIPDGHVGLIQDRSSRGSNGYKVMGGVIDSGYRGELIIVLTKFGKSDIISAGEKVAQLLILPIANVVLFETKELSDSARGEKGFGSSGA